MTTQDHQASCVTHDKFGPIDLYMWTLQRFVWWVCHVHRLAMPLKHVQKLTILITSNTPPLICILSENEADESKSLGGFFKFQACKCEKWPKCAFWPKMAAFLCISGEPPRDIFSGFGGGGIYLRTKFQIYDVRVVLSDVRGRCRAV